MGRTSQKLSFSVSQHVFLKLLLCASPCAEDGRTVGRTSNMLSHTELIVDRETTEQLISQSVP